MATETVETPSQAIVKRMMKRNPKIQCRGFRKAIKAAFPYSEAFEVANFIPDAFHISHERQIVTLIEVDDTNPISAEKAAKIGDFTLAIEDDLWEVVVVVIDYAGMVRYPIPGWAFLQIYTDGLAPDNAVDYAPAAHAAARAIGKAGPGSDSISEIVRLLD